MLAELQEKFLKFLGWQKVIDTLELSEEGFSCEISILLLCHVTSESTLRLLFCVLQFHFRQILKQILFYKKKAPKIVQFVATLINSDPLPASPLCAFVADFKKLSQMLLRKKFCKKGAFKIFEALIKQCLFIINCFWIYFVLIKLLPDYWGFSHRDSGFIFII